MALAYLTINLDAFTGDDHPPVPSYSTITLDPGVDHIDAANDVIHVRSIVVSLDRQGKAATANGAPCVDGRVPVVAGVAYAVSAPNVLRGGPHYIPALTAGQVVDLSDYITPGAPLTPDQAAALTARIVALEATPPGGSTDPEVVRDVIGAAMVAGSGVQITVNDAGDTITIASTAVLPTRTITAGTGLTGGGDLSADRTLTVAYGTTATTATVGNDARVTGAAQKSANLSDLANAATARTNLGLGTAATTAATAYATAAQGAKADTAVQSTLVDAKGDLIVGTADNTVARLPASTNGHVLTLDSAEATGMKWAAAAGGGGPTLPPSFGIPPVAVGDYLPVMATGTHANFTLVNNRLVPCAIYAQTATTVNAVSVYVEPGVGGATIELALYTFADYGRSSAHVQTLGTASAASAGLVTVTFAPFSLAAGPHVIVARPSTNIVVWGQEGNQLAMQLGPDGGSNLFGGPFFESPGSMPPSITWNYTAGLNGRSTPRLQLRRSA